MKTVSVKLPAPLAGWLQRQAKELGRTQSDLIREALEQRRESAPAGANCAQLLQELGGFVQGPPDLSTNPKYMEDFGK
jgi:Arc/MetJ-type ribon-helix-helix transcriptional regulator